MGDLDVVVRCPHCEADTTLGAATVTSFFTHLGLPGVRARLGRWTAARSSTIPAWQFKSIRRGPRQIDAPIPTHPTEGGPT